MKNNTMSNKKTRAIETKNKIYKSADQLFRKYGFEKVSVDSIVEAAGVSKGSFYVHFDSKDSLMAALIADFINKVDLDYKSYSESFPVNTAASDILISTAGRIADVITGTVGYDRIKIIYGVQITGTVNTDAILGYSRDIYKTFSNIINQGIQQGEFKTEIPVDTIAKHYIMALRGLTYEWCVRYPDFNLKDQVLTHFKLLLSGIKKQ